MNGSARVIRRLLHQSIRCCVLGLGIVLVLGICALPLRAGGTATERSLPADPATDAADQLAEIMVEAHEPRFVSPTQRDQIGRIWAPVFINGRGPFRLVLDTGASHTAVTAMVALALGIPTDQSPAVVMRGVTGSATVPAIRVDSVSVGDLAMDATFLPIVPDALGGAEGVLGSEGLSDKRIFIDFHHDKIEITYSRGERSGHDFFSVPFHTIRGQLIVVEAMVGQVHTKAIIDTGGQSTIANLALRNALARIQVRFGKPDQIEGATMEFQNGELIPTPTIEFGPMRINNASVTFADLYIFKKWQLTGEPTILIGMDALGSLDALIIDYRRHEIQMRTQKTG